MPASGKIDRDFFAEYISTRLGARRSDVRKGPKHGVDFGVVDIDGHALVAATDPLSILPALGFERAGRFAIQFAFADVAVSGLAPTHLAVSFSLPPELSDEAFAAVWRGIDAECRTLGAAVVTGHTARYADCQFPWVGSATALAVGDPDDIVYPDGAQPGDRLLVTRGPAVETTGLLTTLFSGQLSLDDETLTTAQERLADTGIAGDALAAANAGAVSAMHDATEGGLLGALFELAASAGVAGCRGDLYGAGYRPVARDDCGDAFARCPARACRFCGGSTRRAGDAGRCRGDCRGRRRCRRR
jgi:hydrogenase maturation factor